MKELNRQYYLMYLTRDAQMLCRRVEINVYKSIKPEVCNYFHRDLSAVGQMVYVKVVKHIRLAEGEHVWDNFFYPANRVAIDNGGI